ncbi:BatD family protein [Microbulbifer pacificus]|uniref:BatD family protein n=1 Tax=Microbulbifer pacificus TaxID=407164 RepID=UPI000CF57F8E|nr:BatD family protein [Microbulbifer pacificus]
MKARRHPFCAVCALLVCMAFFSGAGAQPGKKSQPIVQTRLSQTEIVPGQAVTFQVTVLVPSWLTRPVEFPVLDRPNLSVSLPEKSTFSTSQTIAGSTWSGVVREYRLVPLTPGIFQLPPTRVEVHYRSPDGTNDITATIPLTAERLTVTAPKGAEHLNPYVAARDLTLEQKIDGDPENLRPGDSFSRTVTARIQGSTVMFVPQMLNTTAPSGIAAYADTPRAEDHTKDNGNGRGDGGGTRVEKITYIAEAATRGELPAITLQWYNLDDGRIQTATLAGVHLRVKGTSVVSRISLLHWLIILALLGAAAWGAWRCLPRRIAQLRQRRSVRRQTTGQAALQRLQLAVRQRNYAAALTAVVALEKMPGYRESAISGALLDLGRAQYGNTAATESAGPLWQQLERALDDYKSTNRSDIRTGELPPLNPNGTH